MGGDPAVRLLLASLATTAVPTIVGMRWIDGSLPLRVGAGGLLGFVFLGWGAMIGGLLGAVLPGAIVVLLAAWFLGPRFRARFNGDQTPWPATVVVAIAGGVLLVMSLWRPVAAYDGWAIWSLKAKALAQYDTFDNPVFTAPIYDYSHQFYPPLLPGWQAVSYRLAGNYQRSFPTQFQLAWLWTAGALALAGLGRRRGPAGLFLLAWAASPVVLNEAMKGYADVPASLFAITGAALYLSARDEGVSVAPAAILLAGAAATKLEGTIAAAAFIGALFLWDRRRRAGVGVGALIFAALLPWVIFAVSHKLSGYLALERVPGETPFGRVGTIARQMSGKMLDPALWGVLVPAILVMLVLSKPRAVPTTAALAALAAFFVVYMTTPFNIEWHLSRSVTRVVIGPVGLLALAAATTVPWRGSPRAPVTSGDASASSPGDTSAPAQPSDPTEGGLVTEIAFRNTAGGPDDVP